MSDLGKQLQVIGSLLVVEGEILDKVRRRGEESADALYRLEAIQRFLSRALEDLPRGVGLAIRNQLR